MSIFKKFFQRTKNKDKNILDEAVDRLHVIDAFVEDSSVERICVFFYPSSNSYSCNIIEVEYRGNIRGKIEFRGKTPIECIDKMIQTLGE